MRRLPLFETNFFTNFRNVICEKPSRFVEPTFLPPTQLTVNPRRVTSSKPDNILDKRIIEAPVSSIGALFSNEKTDAVCIGNGLNELIASSTLGINHLNMRLCLRKNSIS